MFKVLLREAGEQAAIQGVAFMHRGRIVDFTAQRAVDAGVVSVRNDSLLAASLGGGGEILPGASNS